MRRQQRGFTLIELMVGSAVTFVTVLAVSAAFLGYTQSFYTQAGIRGGQAALRQTHQIVVRNLRMAGYGMDPPHVFSFPEKWSRTDTDSVNRSDRLVFRMRNPAFNALADPILVPTSGAVTNIKLKNGLTEALPKGQIVQVVCAGGLAWTYVQLSVKADKGTTDLNLAPVQNGPDGKPAFPTLNDFSRPCFNTAAGPLGVNIFKIDVYDYSIRLIDDDGDPGSPSRPYLFRKHGLNETSPADAYGEPVAEDIEAMRVTFLRGDGTPFVPKLDSDITQQPPAYDTPLDHDLRKNNHPANIRAVMIGLVARSSTRDSGASPSVMNDIPAFGVRPEDGTPEPPIVNAPYGFRRFVSEMTVQVRNMRSSQMPVPVYLQSSETPDACKGTVPSEDLNCAGG